MLYKNLSLFELSDLIKNGKTTSEEIYNYFLERTKKYNEELNAFNTMPLDKPFFKDFESSLLAVSYAEGGL